MSIPEADRRDEPLLPHHQDDNSFTATENFLAEWERSAPHLQNLLDPQRNERDGQSPNLLAMARDGQSNPGFAGRRRSPWETDGAPSVQQDTNAGKVASDDSKKKDLPGLTIDEKPARGEKGSDKMPAPGKKSSDKITAPINTEAGSWIPSLNIDTNKLASNALNELENWLQHLVPPEERQDGSKDKSSAPVKAPAAPESPRTVDTVNGNWKKEGDGWQLYDRLGKKQDRYDGKVSDVSKDAEGNTVVKLSDGRSVKEKQDGSTLAYDKDKHLTSINYKDGTSRTFKWEGDELVGMTSRQGEWTRDRDNEGKLKDAWTQKGQNGSWNGALKVDENTGRFTVASTTYNSDLTVEKLNSDGSKDITYPNKDVVKVAKDGLISQINYTDGSERKFNWEKNPDAKGEDDKYRLSGVQVKRDNNYYYHSRQSDGSWKVQTWQNGAWSKPEAETCSFEMNNKTGEYAYTDSADGIRHAMGPGGTRKDTTREGASLEYDNGNLVRASIGKSVREFEWKDNKLVSIRDGVQNKVWTPGAEGGWVSDKGDKHPGDAFVGAGGEIGFKNGDKASIIKMNGGEYDRITNDKDKSQVDIRKQEVQVTAGDGSVRAFKTGPDGKEVLQESVTRNGKTESWTRADKLANGNYTWVNDQDPTKKEERTSVRQENGKLSIEYPDGRKYQANTDGSERLENSKAGWYTNYKNGQPQESKFVDGTIRRYKFDGPGTTPSAIEVTSPEGIVTKMNRISDGVYNYQTGKDDAVKWNVSFTVNRDGTYKYVDNDEKGKIVTRTVDGYTTTENPAEKSRVEKFKNDVIKVERDGKTVELVRDGKSKVTEVKDSASNTLYKRNERGEFVASALDSGKPFKQLDDLKRKGDVVLDESGTTNFIDTDGTQIRQKPGERGELISSKEKTIETVLSNPSLSDAQKERMRKNILEYSARTDITPRDKSIFQESLTKFANRPEISDLEKVRTYDQMNRLLESKSDEVFNSKDRALLAEQLAWHLGNPASNAQGENPNCQVTTIRGRMLYESPSNFARMMTDVITTGKFTTKDGSVIKPPQTSMRYAKGSEEATFPPEDGTRTWLGKISDVTCANIFWQRQTSTPTGEVVNKGDLVYRHDPPTSRKDTGARLYKQPGDGYMYPQNGEDGKLITQPGLYAKDIADTYRQIVGNKDTVVLAVNRQDIKSGPGVKLVDEESLHKFLSEHKGVHIAQIYTATDWVWKEPARKYGFKPKDTTDGEHVVLVKDYDPVTRTVGVDNSWSSKYDHLAPGRRITLHELYQAMAKQS